ncbi:hypothetical protein K502DRAFT_350955 [Neoconidiobolus thromboides FSU 785]|nr:hypothetical protein K502DRAFT_350955 [Neoconidiobolus thromboides FSU 785]
MKSIVLLGFISLALSHYEHEEYHESHHPKHYEEYNGNEYYGGWKDKVKKYFEGKDYKGSYDNDYHSDYKITPINLYVEDANDSSNENKDYKENEKKEEYHDNEKKEDAPAAMPTNSEKKQDMLVPTSSEKKQDMPTFTRDITKQPKNRKNSIKSTRLEPNQPAPTEIVEFEPVSN